MYPGMTKDYITSHGYICIQEFFFFMQYFLTISTVLAQDSALHQSYSSQLHIVFQIISIGTLLAFYLVDNALIYHWYAKLGTSRPLHVLIFLFLLTLSSLSFSLSRKIDGWCRWGMPLFGIISMAITSLPLHSTAGIRHTTIGLVSPHDATACRYICLLECVPDSSSQVKVLPEVRRTEPCDRTLWGALHIHCRRK
jgi:hypothetical protein